MLSTNSKRLDQIFRFSFAMENVKALIFEVGTQKIKINGNNYASILNDHVQMQQYNM
jgi:hypothetical protein